MCPVYLQSSLLGALKRGLHNVSNGARFLQSFVCVIYSQLVYSRGNWICKIRHCINNLYLKHISVVLFGVKFFATSSFRWCSNCFNPLHMERRIIAMLMLIFDHNYWLLKNYFTLILPNFYSNIVIRPKC